MRKEEVIKRVKRYLEENHIKVSNILIEMTLEGFFKTLAECLLKQQKCKMYYLEGVITKRRRKVHIPKTGKKIEKELIYLKLKSPKLKKIVNDMINNTIR